MVDALDSEPLVTSSSGPFPGFQYCMLKGVMALDIKSHDYDWKVHARMIDRRSKNHIM